MRALCLVDRSIDPHHDGERRALGPDNERSRRSRADGRTSGRALARRGATAATALSAAGGLVLAGGVARGVAGAATRAVPGASTGQAPASDPGHPGFQFQTIDNPADPTFNQLLGVNDQGTIAGYDGSGNPAATHPNKGYTVRLLTQAFGLPGSPGGSPAQPEFTPENFPGSAQTQVTAINNSGWTAGFWADAAGNNYGFIESNGVFSSVTDPLTPKSAKVNQLLGINDNGVAVGFYNDAQNHAHAYEFVARTRSYVPVTVPGAVSTTATSINDQGDVAGFYIDASQQTRSFAIIGGKLYVLSVPGGSDTMALGINAADEVVGSYATSPTTTHGFIVADPTAKTPDYRTVDDPSGPGATVINGLSDNGDIVGFYTDAQNNVHGFEGVPTYQFTTLDDQVDPTFNQLLGINDKGVIAGYYGSGDPAATHPNKGYTLAPPYGQADYTNENYPGSQQSQVTGITDSGLTVGFWVDQQGTNRGFVDDHGTFTSVVDPKSPAAPGSTNQLLGVNKHGIAVGFYLDHNGNSHGFTYDISTKAFHAVTLPGAMSLTVTGINDNGDLVGFYAPLGSATPNPPDTVSFLLVKHHYTEFQAPQGTSTQALGVNNADQVVGSYVNELGVTVGFVLSHPVFRPSWMTVTEPNASNSTVVNGINNKGQIVGFFTDAANNVDGFLGN